LVELRVLLFLLMATEDLNRPYVIEKSRCTVFSPAQRQNTQYHTEVALHHRYSCQTYARSIVLRRDYMNVTSI
jgi:hypothetical protein